MVLSIFLNLYCQVLVFSRGLCLCCEPLCLTLCILLEHKRASCSSLGQKYLLHASNEHLNSLYQSLKFAAFLVKCNTSRSGVGFTLSQQQVTCVSHIDLTDDPACREFERGMGRGKGRGRVESARRDSLSPPPQGHMLRRLVTSLQVAHIFWRAYERQWVSVSLSNETLNLIGLYGWFLCPLSLLQQSKKYI